MFCPQADLFFADPHEAPVVPGYAGTLHLLRRDVVSCIGLDPSTGDPTGHQTLWPGAMAILAGVDLLAKFYVGSDAPREVGPRFRQYLDAYFSLDTDDELETLYQLRCSLLHSFGLYSRSRTRVYRFMLTSSNGPLLFAEDDERYVVDLLSLFERFEDAVAAYRADVNTSPDLQANFLKMFDDYGAVGIGVTTA